MENVDLQYNDNTSSVGSGYFVNLITYIYHSYSKTQRNHFIEIKVLFQRLLKEVNI